MPEQIILLDINISWIRLINNLNELYKFGDRKDSNVDQNWDKSNIIYRWVKHSNSEIAIIGETNRKIKERVNNYTSATHNSHAGSTNKKVYEEQNRISANNDFLILEFTDQVNGYNLNSDRERKLAEKLLIGYTKPYLQ